MNQFGFGPDKGRKYIQKLVNNQARVSALTTVGLLFTSAWVAGQLVWQPFITQQVATWTPMTSSTSIKADASTFDMAGLQNSQLFGRYQQDTPKVVEKPKLEDAPKTRLNVVLVGVVTSTTPEKSLAVVANRGKQNTYGVGESIDGTRAKIVQVQVDRVIIDNSGRNETVMLEGLKYSKPVQQPVQRNQQPSKTMTSAEMDKIRADINKDPKQIFQYVRMSQVKRDGNILGYRLSPGKDSQLFNSVGLKSGDVATHLNGQDLRNPAAMTEIFKSLSEMSELNLTVERDGQPYDIYIEL